MSIPEWEEIDDETDVLDTEESDEETGFVGGGGPATTWQGGDHGEDDEGLADTDHQES